MGHNTHHRDTRQEDHPLMKGTHLHHHQGMKGILLHQDTLHQGRLLGVIRVTSMKGTLLKGHRLTLPPKFTTLIITNTMMKMDVSPSWRDGMSLPLLFIVSKFVYLLLYLWDFIPWHQTVKIHSLVGALGLCLVCQTESDGYCKKRGSNHVIYNIKIFACVYASFAFAAKDLSEIFL